MSAPSYLVEQRVPRVRHITSAQNASVKRLRALLQTPEKGGPQIAFEGDHLLAESIRGGLRLETVYLSESRLKSYDTPGTQADIISLPDSLFRKIILTDAPQGIAAIATRPVFQLEE